jgi:hypothetical protein
MAPEPIIDGEGQEEDSSGTMDEDDQSAAAVAPLLNLRFYPSGGSDDDEDDAFHKLLFEDAQEDEKDDGYHNMNFAGFDTREKVVKFADDVAEQRDARRDQERNRKELLSKIARLTDMLKDAEKAVDVEKEKRRKKEKNLLKLAKELKRRNQKRETDMERIEEVGGNIRGWSLDVHFFVTFFFSNRLLHGISWKKRSFTWSTIGFLLKKSWIKRRQCEPRTNPKRARSMKGHCRTRGHVTPRPWKSMRRGWLN